MAHGSSRRLHDHEKAQSYRATEHHISPAASSSFRHSSAETLPPNSILRCRKSHSSSFDHRRSSSSAILPACPAPPDHGLLSYLSARRQPPAQQQPDYEVFYEKRRSAMDFISGIFTCRWSKGGAAAAGAPPTPPPPRLCTRLSQAELLQQARAQQEALLETQDTSDMWEWMMEQQQAIANHEHDLVEKHSPPIPETDEDDGEEEEESDQPPTVKSGPGGGGAERLVWLFEAALLRCRWEINTFCRVYMQQIVKAGYSLVNTLMEMEPKTVFLRRVHASYALESRISAALFRCFESDSFDDSGLTHILDARARSAARMAEYARMKPLDPADALRAHSPAYEPAFHAFSAAKSEELLSLLPAASLAFRSAAQRDRFMEAFLRAAKWAWLLHRLATSASPAFSILRVAAGHAADPMYVELVAVPPIRTCSSCHVTPVEFMITPGFVAPQRRVFRCRAYPHFMCKRSSAC